MGYMLNIKTSQKESFKKQDLDNKIDSEILTNVSVWAMNLPDVFNSLKSSMLQNYYFF